MKHWKFIELQEKALKYKTKIDFLKNDNAAYQSARRKKILNQICLHMIKTYPSEKRAPNFKWTYEKIQDEALKYENKSDFAKKSFNAYQVAASRKILNKICSHMTKRKKIPREKHSRFKWTKEKIHQEALKYKNRYEFAIGSKGARLAAVKLNLLDEVCSHMSIHSSFSLPEKTLFDIIKSIYPKSQKYYDRKVNIKDKPHIKSFELDIYVPELRKAVEFDGKYFHSFKGLKRARPVWPDEDLQNYHGIKDAHFLSKGIEILHIKEEDWIKNQQDCVNKCLEFLRSKDEISFD